MTSFLAKVLLLCLVVLGCAKTPESGFAPSGPTPATGTVPLLSILPASVTLSINNLATFSAAGGDGNYTYSIAFGSGSILATTGNYTAAGVGGSAVVRVTDGAGNTADSIVTINSSLQISPASQSLGLTSNLTFSATGGVSPFVYLIISGAGVINSATGLYTSGITTGAVQIRVTDSLGNSSDAMINVYGALGISPTTLNLTVNNTATFTAASGMVPYTFSIVSGGGFINATNGIFTAPATSGSVVVRVTDSLGSSSTSTVTVYDPLQIAPASQTISANASVTFFASTGGVAPFTYSIVSGVGSINASTGLYTAPNSAGSAVVRVTDSMGNNSDANVTVSPVLVISPLAATLAVNNSVTFSGGGGQTAYIYSIQSGSGSINSLTGAFVAAASAGTTVVKITDALGATATANVTVNSALTIAPTAQSVVVTGTINYSESGGVAPYTYSVFTGGGTVNTSGIYTAPASAGIAVVRVTDALGNFANSNITINNTLAVSPVTVTLAVNNNYTFAAMGGQAPYSFAVQSGGGSIVAATGVYTAPAASGSAVILLTDSLGATATANVIINSGLSISPSTLTLAVNGAQTFAGAGGVSPYTYSVFSGSGTINSVSGAFTAPATAGAVVVRVTDSLGNVRNSNATVVSTLSISPAAKTLAVNNTFTFSGSGGQSPYTFSVQSGGGSIVAATGVFTAAATSGSSVVLVTDAIGQTASANVVVNSALSILPVSQTVAITGNINFTAAGGVSPYNYSVVSGGGSIIAATGVYTAPGASGSAVVRVTDSIGNTANSNITINNSLGISPSAISLAVNNTYTFSAVGGTGPYTFSLQSGVGTINAITGLYTAPAASGSAVVKVTDSLSATATATVTSNAALSISPAAPTLAVNGTQIFSSTGGVAPYAYSIVSGGGTINSSTGAYTAPATAGSVVVRVTDSLSNTSNATVTVVSMLAITPASKTLAVNNSFTFSGSGGQIPYAYSIQGGGGTIIASTGVFTAAAATGSAVVKVTDAIGQTATSNVTVNAALAISPATRTLAVSGTINYATSSGVSPYSYIVFSGIGSIVAASGVYTASNTPGSAIVRVTDSLGNTSDSNVTINPALGITPAAVSLSVNNTYTFSATGGTSPFVFAVQSGGGSINLSTGLFTAPVTAGISVVSVTDSLGATATSTVTVNPGLSISPAASTTAVNGGKTFSVSGGVSPFVFSVVSGGGTINSSTGVYAAPATASTVTVRVTDSMANVSNAIVNVVSALSIIPPSKVLAVNNTFTFLGSGGLAPYTFSIQSGGGSIAAATGVYTAAAAAGSTVVKVTDAIGQTANSNVTVNAALIISPTSQTLVASGLQNFSGSGGVVPYTYSIVSGGGAINTSTGDFTAPAIPGTTAIRVTDSSSNTANATATVVSSVTISPTIKTMAENTSFTFTGGGGQTPYVFSIVSGAGTINSSTGVYTSAVTAGSVVLRVTDALGQSTTASVTVVVPVLISPASVTLAVNNTLTFTRSGGQTPYVFSVQSGTGSVNASSGLYTAPAVSGGAVILVTDAIGQTATANVVVNAALSISPAVVTVAVGGIQSFFASGGVSPYVYSIVSGGGIINTSTGAFTAPATAGSVIVRVTDALSNTSDSTVTVTTSLSISPATKTLTFAGAQTFTRTGGVAPFVYSIVSGGGTINSSTGAFTAPSVSGSVVVRVTDSTAAASNATVTVVNAVSIAPTTKTLAVNNAFTFSASGGQTPYTFSIQSGTGTVNAATGVYTAPSASGSDVVKITDAIGQVATATVTINNALAITPASTTITMANTTTFAVSGGVPVSTYSIFSGTGSVNSSTGVFTPASVGTSTVRATDTIGNISDGTVVVNANLAVAPAAANIVTNGTLIISTTGGVAPMTYSLFSGTGAVDPVTGDYFAPVTTGTDVVRVTDALGNISNSTLTVYAPLTLSPLAVTIAVNGSQAFSSVGGLGAVTFSIVGGGGTINATTGIFTAPMTAGTTVVRVTDTIANTVDATVTVVSSLTISPMNLKLPVSSTATFSAVLGLSPYTYSVVAGGGSIVNTVGTGVYTGGPAAGAASVKVTDAGLNTSTAAVTHIEPVEIRSGAAHTCVRYNEGSVKCWGLGSSGQLGQGGTTSLGGAVNQGGDKLPFVNLGTGRTATAIAVGDNHSCALLDNATVKCWGLNSSGQLGLGDITNRGTTTAQMGDGLPAVNLGAGRTTTRVFAFGATTCAKLDNLALKCWGLNSSGQLGLGDITNRGTSASQMGDTLLAVNLGAGRSALKVVGGFNFTCAQLDNNTLKCWGNATNGQTGYESTTTRGSAASQMGDVLPVVNLGTGRSVVDIESGYSHSCALLDNATIKCWGRNQSGQLGYDNTLTKGAAAGTMGDSLAAVNIGLTPSKLAVGRQSTCVMSTAGTMKCWGLNTSGQLLKGNTTTLGSTAGQMAALTVMNLGTGVVALLPSRGSYFSCVITTNKRIKCFGSAASGALLNASTTAHLGDAPVEVGDGLPWVNH